ncbi:MAG: ribulokinase [Fimbriimonadaceae bacterium]
MAKYSLGLDYGTNSVRAVLVDVANGGEIAACVWPYGRGVDGVFHDAADPNVARQHPGDYGDGFVACVRGVLRESRVDSADIIGIGVDTTGSTPLPVGPEGIALALDPKWEHNINAYAWLWKDHTSYAEAAEITATAKRLGEPYLAKCGGTYSSEWFWSKILRCARAAPEVFAAASSWIELADYVPALITGTLGKPARGVCAAGHKAMYARAWGGLPSTEFLSQLAPGLAALRSRLYSEAVPSDRMAGRLTDEWAGKTGLRAGTPVAVGAFDAHFGAVGAGVKPGTIVKIIGTSTCDCLVHPADQPLADIPGVCGIVEGSVLPGLYGIEAGQSAVGDLFAWFTEFCGKGHAELSEAAARLRPGSSGLVALDWNNGNRTVLVDPLLSGLLVGQTLHTTAAEAYRALIEATAFGALMIIERLEAYGVNVLEVMNCGGIAEKSALTMQIYASVMNRPMKVSSSSQTCALGSAIFGAVVGGAYSDVTSAQAKMVAPTTTEYVPEPSAVAVYRELFEVYKTLHDGFGGVSLVDIGGVMKRLIQIREKARAG